MIHNGFRNIPFSPPDLTDAEITEVIQTLQSGWITTGPRTKLFEEKIAEYIGVKKAVCLNSATAAMELTLRLLGIGVGDEVITSPYTYTASASVIEHVGAKIVLIDVAPDSFEMDYSRLADAVNERTKVIIPVDIAGKMCDYDKIFEIIESKRRLFKADNELQRLFNRVIVLADAAHAFGAVRNGVKCGQVADFTSFSFHAVKNLTTAEGGAVVWRGDLGLDDEWLYNQFMLYSLHGQSKDALAKTKIGAWEYDIVYPAYKCNMTDILASLGLVQLKRYVGLLKRRQEIIEMYDAALLPAGIQRLQHYGNDFASSGHLYLARIPGASETERNEIIMKMAEAGVACNVHYKPLPMMTAYKNMGFDIKDYPNAYRQYVNEITLPLHTLITDEDAEYVAMTFAMVIKQYENEKHALSFQRVECSNNEDIEVIYQIIRRCGEDMYNNQGLEHWKTPYPVDSIKQNCVDKDVFIVKQSRKPIATFQIKFDTASAHLSKVAVSPEQEGRGIGGKCLQYIYKLCSEKGISRLCLDVYDQSKQAISFYLKNGFEIVGSAPTRRFNVYLMEKKIS